MSLNPFEVPKPRDGDYVITRGQDNDFERADSSHYLKAHGCQSVRFVTLDDGRLQIHGYIGQVSGNEVVQL